MTTRTMPIGAFAAALLTTLIAAFAALSPAPAAAATPPPVALWEQTGTTTFPFPDSIFRTQGIASDGESLWFSWLTGIERTDLTAETVHVARRYDAIPPDLVDTGHNHIGDIDVHDGILYAPIEDGPGYLSPWIALYRADDLSWTGQSFELPHEYLTEGVPWVAIDGPRGVAYTAEWNDTTRLNVHRLSDFELIRTVPLDKTVPRIQGAKIFRGSLYIARDNGGEKSIEAIDPETGHVTHLFDRNLGKDYETEGIAFVRRRSGTVMLTTDIYQGDAMTVQMRSYRIKGDSTPPSLTKPKVVPAKIRAGGRSSVKIRLRSSEPATARVQWHRCTGRKGRCNRTSPRGLASTVTLQPGLNRLAVSVRLSRAKGKPYRMNPGSWVLSMTPTDEADVTGNTIRARLTVVKPKRRHR